MLTIQVLIWYNTLYTSMNQLGTKGSEAMSSIFATKPLVKSVLLIALLVLCSLSLSGCRNGDDSGFSPDIEIIDSPKQTPISTEQPLQKPAFELGSLVYDEPSSLDSRDGYDTLVRTDNASYLYASETDLDILESIREIEIIIAAAQEIDIHPSAEICFYFTQEDQPIKTEFSPWQGKWKANIYAEDLSNQGIVIYLLTGGNLPAWLCAGLELYYLEEYDLVDSSIAGFSRNDASLWQEHADGKGLPLFGDEWFVPGLIEDELSGSIQAIANAFVSYISETGQLQKLVMLYMNEATIRAAETMKKELWRAFVENNNEIPDTDGFFMVQYHYEQSKISEPNHQQLQAALINPHRFSILSEHSRIYFDSEELTLEDAELYVYEAEQSIIYVKEWFNYESGNRFAVILQSSVLDAFPGGLYIGNNTIIIRNDVETPQKGFGTTLAHEATHAVEDILGLKSNLPDAPFRFNRWHVATNHFQEGIATMLQYLYLMDSLDHEHAAGFATLFIQALNELYGQDGMIVYDRFAHTVENEPVTIDAATFLDISALLTLRDFDFNFEELIATESKDAVLKKFLHTLVIYDDQFQEGTHYTLFPSFVMYLYEQSNSKDDFIRAYADINLMEEVYGKDILGMLYEWYERFADFL